jgi:hypothetical protein
LLKPLSIKIFERAVNIATFQSTQNPQEIELEQLYINDKIYSTNR